MHTLSRRDFLKAAVGAGSLFGILPFLSSCARNSSKFRMQSPWVNDAEFIGYFVAIAEGYYKDVGLDFEYLSGGPEIVAEGVLMAKRAEIALAPIETVINLIAKEGAPLKIIGTQYQKSPLGVVSLARNGIERPQDLAGKRLAVPAANILTAEAFLKSNGMVKDSVKILPYQYNPAPLIAGEVDATLDFVTNVPFTISNTGEKATSFLLYDHGFPVFNDVVVVRTDTLAERGGDIQNWFRASRRGWNTNFADTEKYPKLFIDSFFKGTGRTAANEAYFNKAQRPLIEHSRGIYWMDEDDISKNIETLSKIGVSAKREMFDTTLLASI